MALEINNEVVLTPPLPAATVMLLRDTAEGLQVLLMRRHAASRVSDDSAAPHPGRPMPRNNTA